jgi:hypothetical protein
MDAAPPADPRCSPSSSSSSSSSPSSSSSSSSSHPPRRRHHRKEGKGGDGQRHNIDDIYDREKENADDDIDDDEEAITDNDDDCDNANDNREYEKMNDRDDDIKDKFVRFENWLRSNGAKFPLLELRKYDPKPSSGCNDDDDDVDDDEDDSEEKKDSGIGNAGRGGIDDGDDNIENGHDGHDGHRRNRRDYVMNNSDRGNDGNTNVRGVTNDHGYDKDGEYDDGSKEMRGVHATSYIPPHTVCVSIPKSCLITVEMGQATPIGRRVFIADLDLDAPKHIYLMIYLLWDMKTNGPNSFFRPYYEILPKRLRNVPIFWTDDELKYLDGSYMRVQIDDRKRAINEDYVAICDTCPEFGHMVSLSEFVWARMIVCSRNFGLLINGHRTSALVPHADMLNHYRPRETKWTFDEDSQCFVITTLQGIGAGEEVYDSYGQKCNHRFLLNYGFCVEKNTEIDGFCPNEVSLEFGLDMADVIGNEISRGKERGRGERGGGDTTGGTNAEVGDLDDEYYRDCWENKLAFWTRGDNNACTTGNPGVVGGESSSHYGTTSRHRATADVDGDVGRGTTADPTTTSPFSSSSMALNWSTDIINNVRSMTDRASTAAWRAAALASGATASSRSRMTASAFRPRAFSIALALLAGR